ncbi:MAG: hypothetical protein Q4G03_01760 [Planctomycetia bacterium]|nr:hypothetical protein [Planctomycetia bacterium]
MHELYHIDPRFNGATRRFPGKNWKHGPHGHFEIKSQYFCDKWLSTDPPLDVYKFLEYNLADLQRQYGRVVWHVIRKIDLKPITEEEAFALDPNLRERYGHK